MANSISNLKTDVMAAFAANLDATTRTKLRDRFVAAYQNEWAARVAAGTVDNAASRGIFAVDKVFDYINDIYRSESHKANVAAVPAAETII